MLRIVLSLDHVAGQQKFPTLKKTTGLYPSRCYYSMLRVLRVVLFLDYVTGQQKVPTLKKTTGLCPSRCYYSTVQYDRSCVVPGPRGSNFKEDNRALTL